MFYRPLRNILTVTVLLLSTLLSGCFEPQPDLTVSTTKLVMGTSDQSSSQTQGSFIITAHNTTVYFSIGVGGTCDANATIINRNQARVDVTCPAGNTLGPGVYHSQVVVYGSTNSNPLTYTPVSGSPTTVDVEYTVEPSLTVSSNSLTFDYVLGQSTPADQAITLSNTANSNSNTSWSADIEYQNGSNWLAINGAQTASGSAVPEVLNVSITNPGVLGIYTAYINVSGSNATYKIQVTLDYRNPTVSIAPPNVLYYEKVDSSAATYAAQTVQIVGENVGWTAVPSQPWVQLSATSGSGPTSVDVAIDDSQIPVGKSLAQVVVADVIGGPSHTLLIEVRKQPHRIQVSRDGVALTSTTTVSKLSDTLTVSENAGVTTAWNASSDQTWLTVTASGNTGDGLVLTADKTGLATEKVYFANVTITSSDNTIANIEVVRVGFYVTTATPTSLSSIAVTGANIISDPIRPYVYVTEQDSCSATVSAHETVSIYNIYTGVPVGTMSAPSGASLSEMAISSNGDTLFVADASGVSGNGIYSIDLNTQTFNGHWSTDSIKGCGDLAYTRVGGRGIILTSNQVALDAVTGNYISSFNSPINSSNKVMFLAPSGNGKHLFTASNSASYHYTLYNDYVDNNVLIIYTTEVPYFVEYIVKSVDIATNYTGDIYYISSENATEGKYPFDIVTNKLIGGIYFMQGDRSGNVEIDNNNNNYFGTGSDYTYDSNLYISNNSGASINTIAMPYIALVRQSVVSGDGQRVIQLSAAAITFVTVP